MATIVEASDILRGYMSPFPGPTPAFNNPAIEPQFYNPSQFFISAISLGQTTTVTTSINHNYVIGQIVRLLIPVQCGCRQLNEQEGIITSIPAANQFVLNILSLNISSFIPPGTYDVNQPQTFPVGDTNSGQINSNGRNTNVTYINGSFINVSP